MIVKLENVTPVAYGRLCEFLKSDDNVYSYSGDGCHRSGRGIRILKARTSDGSHDGQLLIELEIEERHSSRENMLKLFDALDIFPTKR